MLKSGVKLMSTSKALANLFELSSNVKIYVPSTVEVDQSADNGAMVEHVERQLSGLFGGATAYNALGAWVSQGNNELILEKVVIVQSYCSEAQLNDHIEEVIRLALHVKTEMSQEAVSLEVNNKLYFV
jgi:hypothetical protein